jgi:putative inorganic carbon (hco3(-)) transporter
MLNLLSPRPYLLLYLVLYILRPQDFLPGWESLQLMPIVLGITLVSWLLFKPKELENPLYLVVFMFLIAVMLSMAFSGWVGGIKKVALEFGPAVVLFTVTASSIKTIAQLRQVLMAIALLFSVLVFHGIGQSELGVGWTGAKLSQGTRITYVGPFGDPNDLGMSFLLAFAAAAHFTGRNNGIFIRLIGLGLAALFSYGVFLTQSRGAFIGLLLMMAVYIRYNYSWIFTIFMCALGGGLSFIFAEGRFKEIDIEEESASNRVEAWYEGLQMFKSKPLLGVGPGNFTDNHPITAHNSLVLALAELGVVGYTLYFSILCLALYFVFKLVFAAYKTKHSSPSPTKPIQIQSAVMLTLCMAFVGMFVGSMFLSRTYFILTYFLLALIVAAYAIVKPNQEAKIKGLSFALIAKLVAGSITSIVAWHLLVRVLLKLN